MEEGEGLCLDVCISHLFFFIGQISSTGTPYSQPTHTPLRHWLGTQTLRFSTWCYIQVWKWGEKPGIWGLYLVGLVGSQQWITNV